jgi:hypothetical protein
MAARWPARVGLSQLAGGGGINKDHRPEARVPLYVPYADFFQYQAGAGRLAGRA